MLRILLLLKLVWIVSDVFSSSTCGCLPCKTITEGEYFGTYWLYSEQDPRCPSSCLYYNNNTSGDYPKLCMCDPGPLTYTTICQKRLSILEAIKTVEKKVHEIALILQTLPTTRHKRQAGGFSEDENKLLERITNLISYLQSECSSITSSCELKKIITFKILLESTFNNINDIGKTSSGFYTEFDEKRKEFDIVAEKAKEAQTIALTTKTTTVTTSSSTTKTTTITTSSSITKTTTITTSSSTTKITTTTTTPGPQGCPARNSYTSTPLVTTGHPTTPLVTTKHHTAPLVTTGQSTTPLVTTGHRTTPLVTTKHNTAPLVTTGHPPEKNCPVGYKLKEKSRKQKKREDTDLSLDSLSLSSDELEFQMVPIDSNGPMATVEEVNANLDKVLKLLKNCDFVKLEDGSIEGNGYGGKVVKGPCEDCQYKIIRKEKPPDEIYNVNVADLCCFIIRSSSKIAGTSQTFVLTNHSLLYSFPAKKNSTGCHCLYTLYEDLNYKNSHQYCLDEIKQYTCCSEDTGALCSNYGIKTENNTRENGTCSNVCTEIANCSSDIDPDNWCKVQILKEEDNSTKDIATGRRRRSAPVHVPENCIPNVPEPVIQTAVSYPAALPAEPFSKIRPTDSSVKSRVKRQGKSCKFWYFWRFTCTQAYNYPTYKTRKNWYRVYKKERWFKHSCCSRLQPHCSNRRGHRRYSCPKG